MWKVTMLNEEEFKFNDKKALQNFIADKRVEATGKPKTMNVGMYQILKGQYTSSLNKWGIASVTEE